MKRNFFIITLLIPIICFSQSVERDMVVLEISTGTACGSCPGAAVGAEELVANGMDIAVIEYHNYNSDDPFNNSYAASRWAYYNMPGAPISFFDGTLFFVGGGYDISNYEDYLPLYYARKNIPSDFTIEIDGYTFNNHDYSIDVDVNNVNNNTQNNLILQAVITESDIPYTWQNQDHLSFVERLMIPDSNGTPLDFSSNNTNNIDLEFALKLDWVPENCQLVIFIQNNITKEILQAKTIDLVDLYQAFDYNITLLQTFIPRTLCNNKLIPQFAIKNNGMETLQNFLVQYKVNDDELLSYSWTGSIEQWDYEYITLPELDINQLSDTNSFYLIITDPNGVPDEYPDDNEDFFSILKADCFPNPPVLKLFVRTDDYPEETMWDLKDPEGNIIQSGGPYTLKNHLYDIELDISVSDCHSFTIYDDAGDGFTGDNAKYYFTQDGNLYYQNDKFGYIEETQFSIGESVNIEKSSVDKILEIFPNPVERFFEIKCNSSDDIISFSILNKLGQKVQSINNVHSNIENTIIVDTKNLLPGLYFLTVDIGKQIIIKKFIKI